MRWAAELALLAAHPWLKRLCCHHDVSDGALRPSRHPHAGLDLCPLGPRLWAFSPSAPGRFLGALTPASTLNHYSFQYRLGSRYLYQGMQATGNRRHSEHREFVSPETG